MTYSDLTKQQQVALLEKAELASIDVICVKKSTLPRELLQLVMEFKKHYAEEEELRECCKKLGVTWNELRLLSTKVKNRHAIKEKIDTNSKKIIETKKSNALLVEFINEKKAP